MTTVGTNWAGNLAYAAERITTPESVDELRGILAAGGPVSVIGTRHCFNDIADTTGTLISLERMPRDIEILDDSVRVAAGLRYGDVAPVLEENGRALANLASLPHISVAGAVITGTHGSGREIPNLSAAVRSIEIVTASGELVVLRRGDADFGGAVVSLGALGVVTHLELDTEPTYAVAQTVYDAPLWDELLDRLDEVEALGSSVSVFTTLEDPDRASTLWVKRRTDRAWPDASAVVAAIGSTEADGPRHPIPGVDTAATSVQGGVAGEWFERLPHFRLAHTPSVGEEIQSEFILPFEHARAAIQALRGLRETIAPHLFVCEIRTMAADDLWLSPSSGYESLALHFTWHRDEPAVRAVLPALEAALAPFGARPHWGKVFEMSGDAIAALYPRWDDFRALRARLDPEGAFRNAYAERLGL
ncbi:D-arabinono-1,4-lactone oxidase [Microbacterium indicum]|uniref:D-arabinono-1,4-lactone oxidase n=1 Tax=Microbacterium indicum TaxID=358100 RepID=UPI00048F45D5|nr:D-arabinono-1,4-lactone oxidase [Microbacterium indicum]